MEVESPVDGAFYPVGYRVPLDARGDGSVTWSSNLGRQGNTSLYLNRTGLYKATARAENGTKETIFFHSGKPRIMKMELSTDDPDRNGPFPLFDHERGSRNVATWDEARSRPWAAAVRMGSQVGVRLTLGFEKAPFRPIPGEVKARSEVHLDDSGTDREDERWAHRKLTFAPVSTVFEGNRIVVELKGERPVPFKVGLHGVRFIIEYRVESEVPGRRFWHRITGPLLELYTVWGRPLLYGSGGLVRAREYDRYHVRHAVRWADGATKIDPSDRSLPAAVQNRLRHLPYPGGYEGKADRPAHTHPRPVNIFELRGTILRDGSRGLRCGRCGGRLRSRSQSCGGCRRRLAENPRCLACETPVSPWDAACPDCNRAFLRPVGRRLRCGRCRSFYRPTTRGVGEKGRTLRFDASDDEIPTRSNPLPLCPCCRSDATQVLWKSPVASTLVSEHCLAQGGYRTMVGVTHAVPAHWWTGTRWGWEVLDAESLPGGTAREQSSAFVAVLNTLGVEAVPTRVPPDASTEDGKRSWGFRVEGEEKTTVYDVTLTPAPRRFPPHSGESPRPHWLVETNPDYG